MAIYIGENAFITLTLSAIETSIKYEASGILMGYEASDVYYIESVIPYQVAERTDSSIHVDPRKRERIRRVFNTYMKYQIIGEFHTHPEGDIELSEEDKKVIRSSDYELEIVVAIEKTNSSCPWDYEKGVLSGSIDKYLVKIAGWKVGKQRITKQTIRCPYAVGFDFSKPLK